MSGVKQKKPREQFGEVIPIEKDSRGKIKPDTQCRKWRVRKTLGRDSSGKRIVFSDNFAGTKTEARDYLREIQRRFLAGEPLKPQPASLDSFASLVEAFLVSRKMSVSESTLAQYMRLVRLYLEGDPIMRMVASQIEAGDIDALYARLGLRKKQTKANGPLALATLRHVHVLLSMIFKFGVQRKKLKGSPMVAVRAPKPQDETGDDEKSMDVEQARKFLAACKGTRFETLFTFAMLAGVRSGELCSLQWSDIDSQARTVTIRRNIVWRRPKEMEPGAAAWYLKAPKSKRSKRTITVTPGIIRALEQEKRRQMEMRLKAGPSWRENGFIWADERGGPFRPQKIYDEMQKILLVAGLPLTLSPHSMRHTQISLLIGPVGADVVSVSRQAGHARTSVTTDVYAHAMPGASADLTAELEALLIDADNTLATNIASYQS